MSDDKDRFFDPSGMDDEIGLLLQKQVYRDGQDGFAVWTTSAEGAIRVLGIISDQQVGVILARQLLSADRTQVKACVRPIRVLWACRCVACDEGRGGPDGEQHANGCQGLELIREGADRLDREDLANDVLRRAVTVLGEDPE